MAIELNWVVEHGSYMLLFLGLIAAGVGIPVPEDIFLLAGGILVERQVTSAIPTLVVCFTGVIVGDCSVFLFARRLGPIVLQHRIYQRLLSPERQDRLEGLLMKHGGKIIFVARFLAGLRAPMFALAGLHRMPFGTFLFWDLLALILSAPIIFLLGYYFSSHIDALLHNIAGVKHFLLIAVVLAIAVPATYAVGKRFLSSRN